MTCKQMGGVCDKELKAETFEEMVALSKQHGMEMYMKQDEAHLKIMNEMMEMMKDPVVMEKFIGEKEKEFEALPEDK